MSEERLEACRDCRYCKLTVKAAHISFRCVKHSWPCRREKVTCDSFRIYDFDDPHLVIHLAWELTEDRR